MNMKALKVDGKFGKKTKKRLQKWLKVAEDGVVGTKTIKALQKKVKAKVDGKWGKGTTKKLQKYLNQYSQAGLAVDGIFGVQSKKALQRHLNKVFKKQITPDVKPSASNGDKITHKAKEFAYAYGTKRSVYSYPKGKPKQAYKKGLQEAYGSRKGWGKQTKAGASCDVFAGTCIRCSGVDKKFPRGLDEQIPHIKKSSKWKRINPKKQSDLKAGDIVIYKKSTGGGHICIYIGGGKYCEAGYNSKRYGCTVKKGSEYAIPSKHTKGYKFFGVYRSV